MSPGDLIDKLSPHARVATALIPFIGAIIVLRLISGKNRFRRTVLSLATMWFAINLLVAPYSMADAPRDFQPERAATVDRGRYPKQVFFRLRFRVLPYRLK